MSIARNIMALAGISLMVGTISSTALAASKRTEATALADARQIVRMMDRDQNGAVSKEEFVEYMSGLFDRLDVNANRQLEASEVRPLTSSNWLRCDALAAQRGIAVNERRSTDTGPSAFRQFMTSCLAGKIQ